MKKIIFMLFSTMAISSFAHAASLDGYGHNELKLAENFSKDFTRENSNKEIIQMDQQDVEVPFTMDRIKSAIVSGDIECYVSRQENNTRKWVSGTSYGGMDILIPSYKKIKQVHMVVSQKDGSLRDIYVGPRTFVDQAEYLMERSGLNDLQECPRNN